MSRQTCPVFSGVFFVARKFYLLFQCHAAEDNHRQLNRVRQQQPGPCCVGLYVCSGVYRWMVTQASACRLPGGGLWLPYPRACTEHACTTSPRLLVTLQCTACFFLSSRQRQRQRFWRVRSHRSPSPPASPFPSPQGWGLTGLSWTRILGSSTAVIGLDSRGERTREQIMRPATWAAFQDQARLRRLLGALLPRLGLTLRCG
jgi:hypothetical protein